MLHPGRNQSLHLYSVHKRYFHEWFLKKAVAPVTQEQFIYAAIMAQDA